MKDISLDTLTHDLSLTSGDLTVSQESDFIRQRVKQSLGLFSGEWFLDTSVGLPYYQYILVKNPDLNLIEGLLRDAILSSPGIAELTRFEFDYNNSTRSMSVSFDAKCTNGQTITLTQGLGV